MKCPRCKFVASNKKDVCPQCHADLRQYKTALGLPVFNPNATLAELVAGLEQNDSQQEPAPQQAAPPPPPQASAPQDAPSSVPKKTDPVEKKHWLKKLLAKAETPSPAQEKNWAEAFTSVERKNPLEEPTQQPAPAAAAPKPEAKPDRPVQQQAAPPEKNSGKKAEQADADLDRLFSDLQFDSAEIPIDAAEGIAEDEPLHAMDEGSIDDVLDVIRDEPAAEAKPGSSGPVVAPSVVEFTDDDAQLTQKLDEMLGDTVVDVTSVKQPKKAAAPTEEFEFSFELDAEETEEELEEEDEDEPPAHSGDIEDDLASELQSLEAEAAEISLAEDDAGSAEVQELLEQELEGLLAEALAQKTAPDESADKPDGLPIELLLHSIERQIASIPVAAQAQIVRELIAHLDRKYHRAQGAAASSSAPVSGADDALLSLQRELEAEIGFLAQDGTTFLGREHEEEVHGLPSAHDMFGAAAPAAHADDQEAEHSAHHAADPGFLDDALSALQGELQTLESTSSVEQEEVEEAAAEEYFEEEDEDRKVRAKEGGDGSTAVIDRATLMAEEEEEQSLHDPSLTGIFLLSDIERLIDETGAKEEPAEAAPAQPVTRVTPPASGEETEALWTAVDSDLARSGSMSAGGAVELSMSDLTTLQPDDRFDVLFDLADDEIANPDKIHNFDESLHDSEARIVDTDELDRDFAQIDRLAKKLNRWEAPPQPTILKHAELAAEPAADVAGPASLFRRGLAAAADLVVCFVLATALGSRLFIPGEMFGQILGANLPELPDLLPVVFGVAFTMLFVWLALNSLLIWGRSQTVGQKLFRISVYDTGKRPLSLSRALLFVMSQISTVLTLGLGNLLALGKTRATLHDRMAGAGVFLNG